MNDTCILVYLWPETCQFVVILEIAACNYIDIFCHYNSVNVANLGFYYKFYSILFTSLNKLIVM